MYGIFVFQTDTSNRYTSSTMSENTLCRILFVENVPPVPQFQDPRWPRYFARSLLEFYCLLGLLIAINDGILVSNHALFEEKKI